MRSMIRALVLATLASACLAGERPAMVSPPSDEQAVKDLLGVLCSACSERNFRRYIECFTPNKAASIRKSTEDAFICHDLNMDVLEHFIISSDDESIVLGVRYKLDKSGDSRVFHSKVVLKNVDSGWKIDSEQVRKVKAKDPPAQTFATGRNANPACPGGRCNLPAPQAQWRYPNPANGGEEAWLPRDIGYRPGPSCANGQCRIK